MRLTRHLIDVLVFQSKQKESGQVAFRFSHQAPHGIAILVICLHALPQQKPPAMQAFQSGSSGEVATP